MASSADYCGHDHPVRQFVETKAQVRPELGTTDIEIRSKLPVLWAFSMDPPALGVELIGTRLGDLVVAGIRSNRQKNRRDELSEIRDVETGYYSLDLCSRCIASLILVFTSTDEFKFYFPGKPYHKTFKELPGPE